ncbi:conjugative transposon protein TraM [Mucilaginibacter gossypii]|uniref:Bacteroides conjugative transposon TraM protein n=1 Tax=Mucilaginibacter gossypii TaxID=551996 RepID=A0A1G8CT77_9SPHI|nr:conjugative transposon protein TraM [Mucilaginibacter gossypii]SDH48524.1 Bacteroides conjugative transposon TraM protein [Mucilaginibacter gossypii]
MEKQRKFLMVLPLLIIPFLTMAFWALGGGKAGSKPITKNKGLDTDLPEAQFNDKASTGKMAVYQAAQHDSTQDGVNPAFLKSMGLDKTSAQKTDSIATPDDQAKKIQVKLAQLNKQLSQPQEVRQQPAGYDEPEPQQVKQLKKMMRNMNGGNNAPDPEMRQLNNMLDKIQAIQNPASVKTPAPKKEAITPFRAIPAIVDGKQKVADGAAVRLKLTDTVTIKNQLLQKGQQLFGVCQVTNQRLLLTIQNIRLDKQIIPVDLTVFSLDGMPGIPAPEAELSGAASGGADEALQSMQFLTMDQSLGAQAAAGGVNAAKGLFSKKIRKIKVKLSNEYPVLLRDNGRKN